MNEMVFAATGKHRVKIIHFDDGSFWVGYHDYLEDKKYGASPNGWVEIPEFSTIPDECRLRATIDPHG